MRLPWAHVWPRWDERSSSSSVDLVRLAEKRWRAATRTGPEGSSPCRQPGWDDWARLWASPLDHRPPTIRSFSPERGGIVTRGGLFEWLAGAGRVTVVSAPAGSGKTFLLRSWIGEAGLSDSAAWVSAGRDEPDPGRF